MTRWMRHCLPLRQKDPPTPKKLGKEQSYGPLAATERVDHRKLLAMEMTQSRAAADRISLSVPTKEMRSRSLLRPESVKLSVVAATLSFQKAQDAAGFGLNSKVEATRGKDSCDDDEESSESEEDSRGPSRRWRNDGIDPEHAIDDECLSS